MIGPIQLLSREYRDILSYAKFRINSNKDKLDLTDTDQLYQFADTQIKPIQIKSEILSLIDHLKTLKPKSYCEIGLANGGTCFLICQSLNSLEQVYGIDTHIFNKRLQKYFLADQANIQFKTGNSTAPKTIEWLKHNLSNQPLDVLFIDGDHSYEGVKNDFQNYHQYVKENGVIIFHDIVLDHGQRFGKQTNRYTGGVPQFYQEISSYFNTKEFVEDPNQDGFGIGILNYRKKDAQQWREHHNTSA